MSYYKQAIESLFKIYDKTGTLVDFNLNGIQARVNMELQSHNRISILKFRQGGVSTYIMARFLVKCMSTHTIAVMLAHDKDHTVKLLERAQLMIKHLKHDLQPDTGKMNEGEIYFRKTDSSFYIGTAGSRDFGRSATITDLHLSEIAFYKDPKRLLTGLLQSVPKDSGTVIQETTANGWGTWFQRRFYDYIDGKSGFKACFYPWWIHEEYRATIEAPPPYTCREAGKSVKDDPTIYEQDLIDKGWADLFQIQWRREKIDEFEGDLESFQQEYPATVREAFKLSGGSLFSFVEVPELEEESSWTRHEGDGWILKGHPNKAYHYSLGADAAGGTGGDYAAIEIGCLETMEQVYSWRNNKISPPEFAEVIAKIGKMFYNAYLVPESNSHGLSVLYILKQIYKRQLIYKYLIKTKVGSSQTMNIPSYGYGWKTTEVSKHYMVGIGQKLIKAGYTIHSPILANELLSFSETESGKLEGMGEHDDTAMSFLLMCIGLLKLSKRLGISLEVETFDETMDVVDEAILADQVDKLRKEAQNKEAYDKHGRVIFHIEDFWGPKHRRSKGAIGNLLT